MNDETTKEVQPSEVALTKNNDPILLAYRNIPIGTEVVYWDGSRWEPTDQVTMGTAAQFVNSFESEKEFIKYMRTI